MKTKSALFRIFIGAVALCSASAAFADDDVRVGVVVEVTPDGQNAAEPAPGHPVYYEPFIMGYRAVGGTLTYWQRPPPPTDQVKHALVQALAAQGFQVAPAQTAASQVLVCRWGVVDPEMQPFFDPKDNAIDKIEPVNADDMLGIVVGRDWRSIYPTSNADARELVFKLHEKDGSRYFLIISALDAHAFANHQQELLWRAHVTTLYWGHYLDQVMGTMITASAPLLGKGTIAPRMITAPAAPL